ncbi:MAG: DNA repair protein RecO [Acidobacteria bacterium]|nr:DNA repair protein RecO [Acidobacteriota bacterium]
MEIHTDDALVLESRDLSDADRLITFLIRGAGKKKGVARGARRKHSRYAGQFLPLSKVALTWVEKPGRELVRISSAEVQRSSHRLQEDLDGILLAGYLADQAAVFVQEDEPGDLYFRLLDSTVEALLERVPGDLAARFFEAWVLRLAGIFPPPQECPRCGRSLAAGARLPSHEEALLCPECGGEDPAGLAVPPEVVAFFRDGLRRKLPELAQAPPEPATLRRAEEVCARIRRSFLQQELRSYRVLQQTRRSLGEL